MAKSHKKSARRRRRNSIKGGSAWQYAQSVYGDAASQHAVGPLPNGGTNNVIAMNHQSGGNAMMPDNGTPNPMMMGDPMMQQSGGNDMMMNGTPNPMMMGDAAQMVPPVQMGGQHVLSPANYSDNGISSQGMSVLPAASASSATNILSMNGMRGMSGGRRRRRGGNVLGEIAVPATLLIANEFAKNMNKSRKTGKSNRRKIFSNKHRRR